MSMTAEGLLKEELGAPWQTGAFRRWVSHRERGAPREVPRARRGCAAGA